MAFLGKEVRMNRLLSHGDGKFLGITVDHAIARGVIRGLDTIVDTLGAVAAGRPDAITMQKGIAERCFAPYAGKIPLALKCTSTSPYQPDEDTLLCDVEEAVRLGADAVSVGCIVCGDKQAEQIAALALMAKKAASFGMPLIGHVYPRGLADKSAWSDAENVTYAARLASEVGVDIIKTTYTGDAKSFEKVARACPSMVVAAGGEPGKDLESYFTMTRNVLDAGGAGVTYGRFVFQYKNPGALIRALGTMVHGNASVREAMEFLTDLENTA